MRQNEETEEVRERMVVCENEWNRRKDSMCVGSRERMEWREREDERKCVQKKEKEGLCL